jgi:hypothetical protein
MKSVDFVLWTTSSTPHLSDEKTPRPLHLFQRSTSTGEKSALHQLPHLTTENGVGATRTTL